MPRTSAAPLHAVSARAAIVAFAALTLGVASGCTPTSQYRYTGMVPAARPIPFDGRTAEKGTATLEGSITHEFVDQNGAPVLHDTALHVPETTVEGSAVYSIHDHVEIGARVSYAHYGWTEGTAVGTPPLPDRPSQLGAGPEMRLAFPLDRRHHWALGAAWNFMRYTVPTAEWEKTTSCAPGPKCYADTYTAGVTPTYYSFRKQTSESVWLLNVSLLLSYAFGERGDLGHVFGGLAFHPTFGNDGFTDTSSTDGKIQQKGWMPMALAGYGIRLAPARLGASLFFPMGGDAKSIAYGFGGQLTVGIELGGSEERPAPPSGPAAAAGVF